MQGREFYEGSENLEELLQKLWSYKREDRKKAIEKLASMRSPAVKELLYKSLREKNRSVGHRIAESLGKMGGEDVVAMLIKALKSRDRNVRLNAAWAFKEVRSEQGMLLLLHLLREDKAFYLAAQQALKTNKSTVILQELVRGLWDKKNRNRKHFAMALGDMEEPAALPYLIQCLLSHQGELREGAILAFKHGTAQVRSGEALNAMIRHLRERREKLKTARVRKGFFEIRKEIPVVCSLSSAIGYLKREEVVPLLIEFLEEEKDRSVRICICRALAEIGCPRASGALLPMIFGRDPRVAEASAETLRTLKDPTVIPDLLEALGSSKAHTRLCAIMCLEYAPSPKVVEKLAMLLQKDRDVHVRRAAARVLGVLKQESALPSLLQALRDKDPLVGWNAAWAIGSLKTRGAIPPLLLMLKEKGLCGRNAAEALGGLGMEDDGVLEGLLLALTRRESRTSSSAAWALRQINLKGALALLYVYREMPDKRLRRISRIGMQKLRPELASYAPHFPVKSTRFSGIWL